MQLLIYVLREPRELQRVLEALGEAGILGATVIDSQGVGRAISEEVPLFAPLTQAFHPHFLHRKTVMVVLRDKKVPRAIKAIEEVVGNLEEEDRGILVTLPVNKVIGIASETGLEEKKQ